MFTPLPLPFSAALIAGGQSTRMGSDKAVLEVAGQPLWRHQLALLEATGADDLFIAGGPDGPWAGTGFDAVPDRAPELGPLAGLEAALRRAKHEWLLVLAVDLPDVPPGWLRALVAEAMSSNRGQVPAEGEWLQPIAAVYPRRCLPLVQRCLAGENRSLRRFVRLARREGQADVRLVTESERALFRNLNTPADLRG